MGLLHIASTVIAQEGTSGASGPEVFGIGSVVLLLTVVAVLGWMAYLYLNSRRSRAAAPEETPPNLRPYLSDDELENRRTTGVLRAALIGAGVLAVVLPWYAFNEPNRQSDTAVAQEDLAVEAGGEYFTHFSCYTCHGSDLGGGAAPYTEERSGVATSWAVPSLNDVFFRFDDSEVRSFIVYGRAGTPMPANGLEGGGAMNSQEIDRVLAYIHANQISQADTLAKTDTLVGLALNRIAAGDDAVQSFITVQQAKIDDVEAAPAKVATVGDMPTTIADLLSADGTCTDRSAELVTAVCSNPGLDTDRDGLTDAAEEALSEDAATALANLPVLQANGTYAQNAAYEVSFDPGNAYTNAASDGSPIADLDAASTLFDTVTADVTLLNVAVERQDQFVSGLQLGLDFLDRSAEQRLWNVDYAQAANDMNDRQAIDWPIAVADTPSGQDPPQRFLVSGDQAQRAVGLFNAYCARCHTAGYSAGSPFEDVHGSGAWGPSLLDGRAAIQFPNWLDQVDFVVNGTEFGKHYGVNGLGTGRMPSFGQILTSEDIELIVLYERTF